MQEIQVKYSSMKPFSGCVGAMLLLIAGLLSISGCSQQSIAPIHSEAAFQTFAEALLVSEPARQKIAIRPFTARESPIPLTDANRFNDSLEQAIRERFPGRFRFVPRAALQKIAADANEFGQIEDFTRYVRRQQADILIYGQLELIGDQVLLGYSSASPATGRVLAKTPTRTLDYRLPPAPALELEPALALLADKLTADRLSIQRLYRGGILFEESGIQTRLGYYLMQRLDVLVKQRLRYPAHSANDYLEAEKRGELPENSYLLGGQYWAFKDHIELRVSLKGHDLRRVHQVRIAGDSIPKRLRAAARPPLQKPGENDHLGPNSLYLSSDRGLRPVYRIGDEMRLTLQAGEAGGYLYCFDAYYRRGRPVITRIFPNRYHRDPYISPQQALQLPDESMDFVFTLHPPAGPEYVRCYLFDRDVTRQLPREIVAKDLVPLAVNSLEDLNTIMRGIPDTRLNQATLALTVEAQ
jgi:hypothetical protein